MNASLNRQLFEMRQAMAGNSALVRQLQAYVDRIRALVDDESDHEEGNSEGNDDEEDNEEGNDEENGDEEDVGEAAGEENDANE